MESATSAMAAYERVAAAIRDDIRSGTLQDVDNKLPGHRRLAQRYDVSLGTAQKAVHLLEKEGWLSARPAVGVFVNIPLPEGDPTMLTSSIHDQLSELRSTTAELATRIERLERALRRSDS
ncbi:winged helix-turn-helix domain-containing protein [Nocardia sp. NPDC051030]|uniref:winged helix-turn-helix domain-containing protein n=1 Tax=Nocardia sp. NPDC051030 TaxID=3155162 RepID=UPI00343EF6E5